MSTMDDTGKPLHEAVLLSGQVQHRLRRAYQRASGIFADAMGDTPVTPTQWAALTTLDNQGVLSQNRLGRLTYMDPATIQGVILRLEERRLVERSPDPEDRRRTSVRLTRAGLEAVDTLMPKAVDAHNRTLAPLTPEERMLFLKLLARLM